MLHPYNAKEIATCFPDERRVVFIGDSTTRTTFYAVAKQIDPNFNTNDGDKHSDRVVKGANGFTLEFFWDPFLNGTATANALASRTGVHNNPPALLVFGSGLWYLRHMDVKTAVTTWDTAIDRIFTATLVGGEGSPRQSSTGSAPDFIADEVVVLPVQYAVEQLLSADRAASISNTAIREMNMLLKAKEEKLASAGHNSAQPTVVEVPWSFNAMLGEDAAEVAEESVDGLHFSDRITKHQANILLNLRCNDVMPKKFPCQSSQACFAFF